MSEKNEGGVQVHGQDVILERVGQCRRDRPRTRHPSILQDAPPDSRLAAKFNGQNGHATEP